MALLLFLTLGAERAGLRADAPERSERVVSYAIRARRLPAEQMVRGTMDLVWRNTCGKPMDHLWFHLYLNAFRDRDSSYQRESKGDGKSGAKWEEDHPGSILVTNLHRGDGRNLWGDLHRTFECPDDGNEKDATLARLSLPAPVPPGETLHLEIEFESRLPRVMHRTGWAGDPEDPSSLFFMVAQWFPKVAVLERDAEGEPRWNAHQFHRNTEFFSDYGVYEVALTVPQGFVVGATGARTGVPVDNGDGTITVVHRAEDVHDFAWTASPHFVEQTFTWSFESFCADAPDGMGERVREAARESARRRGLDLAAAMPPGEVEVRLLLQPDHAVLADRFRWSAGAALALCGLWYGAYPYPVLTIVDPPAGGRAAGGMEYPTLITVWGDRMAPSYDWGSEAVTIHEFGHQYFYGLVGSNEFEQAWLDEGFTSFTDRRVQEIALGPRIQRTDFGPFRTPRLLPFAPPSIFGRLSGLLALDDWIGKLPHPWKHPDTLLPVPRESPFRAYLRAMPPLHGEARVRSPEPLPTRGWYLGSNTSDAMDLPGWHFASRGDYSVNAYAKPVLFLYCLRGLMGEEPFERALHAYATRYRFAHPRGTDFLAVAREHAPDVALFEAFAQAAVESATRLDVAVLEVTSVARPDGQWDWGVRVQRRGDVPLPIEIWGEDDRGELHLLETWRSAGRETTRALRAVMPRPLHAARLGPSWLRLLDADITNNARRSGGAGDMRAATTLALRYSLYAEEIVRSYAGAAR